MLKQLFSAILVIVLVATFSTLTFAQESTQKEAKKDEKMEMTKSEKQMGALKSISCDPTCGFMVRSHDEKEVIAIAKAHAKKVHKMDLTDKKAREMMKTEEGPTPK